MGDTEYFLSTRPAYPWSEYPLGLPALAAVAALLILFTLWAYLKHPASTRRRVSIVLALRLAALVVALMTALRPSVGIQEDPKVPSVLLIGVDLSESMTIRDEINSQARIDAVRRVLEKCQPILDELRTEQNVNVAFYAVGKPDFDEATGKYAPELPAAFPRTDYGTYLNRTLEKWQAERFVRGHLLVGDGADNGTRFSAQAEAARWRAVCPVHTFAVGSDATPSTAKDVGIAAVAIEPSPVPVKNDVTVKLVVNAYGFAGAKLPVRVWFGDAPEPTRIEEVALPKESGNEVLVKLKAPDKPGEVKVRVEIPAPPGDASTANNSAETYMTVSKEGLRLLVIDRLRQENAQIRRVFAADRRVDPVQVIRQRDEPATPDERELLDFDSKAYDAIILGNVSARQLNAIDPNLMRRIAEQVTVKGTGLMLVGGDATFLGSPARPLDNGFKGTPLEPLLPVTLGPPPAGVPPEAFTAEDRRFQTVPTLDGLKYVMNVLADPNEGKTSGQLWDRLNAADPPARLTAVNPMGTPKPGATVFAVAYDRQATVPAGQRADLVPKPAIPLLVGWTLGDGSKGRVMAFAGYDTYNWTPFGLRGQPKTRDGLTLHAQFWRRLALWLAKQEEEDGAAFARPEFRRVNVNGKQTVRVGLRSPGGADAKDPKFTVRVVAPGQQPEDAPPRAVVADANGSKVVLEPPVPGEYTVLVSATGTDAAGKEIKADAAARFLAYAEASDEMLRAAADHDHLDKLAKAGGGRAFRLEDLPQYLKDLRGERLTTVKPKPRFVPDWRRDHSGAFLPGWLVAFVALLAAEWGLRRLWGMA